MACEDFPCCGHESGCCPDFNEAGEQLNMICVCGARIPVTNRVSICDRCLIGDELDDFDPDRYWDDLEEFEQNQIDEDASYDRPDDGEYDLECEDEFHEFAE